MKKGAHFDFKDFGIKEYVISILVIVLLLGIFFVYWYYFLYFERCNDQECFFDKLQNCEKSQFTFNGNITFNYKILYEEEDSCVVKVRLLRSFWRGNVFDSLTNKEMECYLNKGKLVFPETDLDKCYGPLKEGLQELIIQKLHKYVLDNLAFD